MQKYGDIVLKIKELIEASKERKKELSDEELKNYSYYFARVLNFDICVEYIDEFKELLELERTFFAYQNNKTPLKHNDDLILLCIEKIESDSENIENYVALKELLEASKNKSLNLIVEHKGYYILKDRFEEFIELCQVLNVGPFRLISELSREELQNYADTFSKNSKEQLIRLTNVIDPKLTSEDAEKVIYSDNTSYILLGLHGKMTLDYVATLKAVLGVERFESLLVELESWMIFTKEEISEIREMALAKNCLASMLDLVQHFSKQKDIDVRALANIIPAIGVDNYKFLVFELYKLGVINSTSYKISKNIIKQFEDIKKRKKSVD